MIPILFVLSLVGGFCSGFLGVGGAVVLIPLLLNVPPLFGARPLSMSEVSGLTMIQVLASSITGCLVHRRGGFAHVRTILSIGIPMGIFSFSGAAVSRYMSDFTMMLIFGCLVVFAFVVLVWRPVVPSSDAAADEVPFNLFFSVLAGALVGFVSGVVGAGGGFVLIPVMVGLLRIPIKVAVGSSLGIIFFGAVMGSVGKMLTLQVQWIYLLPVIAGCLPAAFVGAHVSKRLPAAYVRFTLVGLIFLIMVQTWWKILSRAV